MLKTAALFFCCAAMSYAQCPAGGETNVNTASAATLASVLHISDVRAGDVAAEIRGLPLSGYSDLQALAIKYRFDLPGNLVVCPRPGPAASADSVDLDQDRAVNVNSGSEQELSALKSCGVSGTEISAIAAVNLKGARFTAATLRAFLASHTPSRYSASFCRNLTFKYTSR